MSFWTSFIVLVGIVGSLLTIFEFIRARTRRSRRLAFLFGAVTIALLLVSAIFANVLSPLASSGSGSTPTQNLTTTPLGKGGTSTPTQAVPTATPSPTQIPTATSSLTPEYSAPQPGPGCDTGKGTWTPQGISGVSCGSWVTNSTGNTWGYLNLQLPNNAAFAANNEISVTLGNIDSLNFSCIGLAEIGSTTGYLASFCLNDANPNWAINLVSNQGTIIQPLSTNATSIRTNTALLLSLVNNTLKFTIGTESHQISITSFQPTKVAIAFYNNGCGNCTAETSNFNYITPAS